MALSSIILDDLLQDEFYDLWNNNDFPFFTDDPEVREEFKKVFEETYWRYEIGEETAYSFKRALYGTMRKRASFYAQMYESELKMKGLDFMLNKDYREEFIRTMNTDGVIKSVGSDSNTSTNNGKGTSITNGSSTSDDKGSDINDGVSTPTLEQGLLTSVSNNQSTDNSSTNTTDENTSISNGTNNNDTTNSEKIIESYVTEGKGNIGITSAADLLKGWRSVMISTVELYVEELRVHFMYYYNFNI